MLLKVKVDTGANANVITMRALPQIYPEKFVGNECDLESILSKSTTTLSGYGGSNIKQLGCFKVTCKRRDLVFFVVDSNSPNIIGLEACRDFNLVKINCAIKASVEKTNKPTTGKEIQLDATIHHVLVSDQRKAELQKETANDDQLAPLLKQITEGWPETVENIPRMLRPYWSIRDLLSVDDGLLLKGSSIIIPKIMQKSILDKIHNGHQGRDKCQLLARDNVFWFGMTKDIERTVRECDTCNKYGKRQTKQHLLQPEVPNRPFEKLAADIFQFEGKTFLLLADYYSKMPFIKTLRTMTSTETIRYIESVLAIHGIPKTLVTDNAKQFTSMEFKQFTKEWDFNHITSSPHYPKSNGFIERTVRTVQLCLKKAKESRQNPQIALLNLRTTPVDNSIPSSAEILFNRTVRTILPCASRQCPNNGEQIRNQFKKRQSQQKKYYDRTSKYLPPLADNQPIYMQHPVQQTWEPATIISTSNEPRSYIIENPAGGIFRRNRVHPKEKVAGNMNAPTPTKACETDPLKEREDQSYNR